MSFGLAYLSRYIVSLGKCRMSIQIKGFTLRSNGENSCYLGVCVCVGGGGGIKMLNLHFLIGP